MGVGKNVHAPGCASEAYAAAKAAQQEMSIRRWIMRALARGDMTPDEFAAENDLLLNTVRRRFTDLWKDGHVRWTGKYRKNRRNNPSKVWEAGEDPKRGESRRRASAADRIASLEADNAELKKRISGLEADLAGTQRSLFT